MASFVRNCGYVKELQSEQRFWIAREIDSLWKDLEKDGRELKMLQRSINTAIFSFALAAGAIIFNLLRTGVVF